MKRRPAKKREKTPEIKGSRAYSKPVDVCGQIYRILVDPTFHPKKNQGQCDAVECLIEILDQSESRMHDTLLHELVHAIWDASGLKWELAERFKKLSRKERADLEEMIARFLAPALLGTLRGAGWLKLPKWPRHRSAKNHA